MLDTTIRAQLTGYLERLRQPLELTVSLDRSENSDKMRELLEDIASCSGAVTMTEQEGEGGLSPSFGISTPGAAARVRFAGLPMGHEFSSLVLALLQVGGHPPKLAPEVATHVSELRAPLNFEVFISLSCHNCPDVVQALNTMAALNPLVSCTTVDGALFPQLVQARDVMAVPAVFLNGKPFASGRMSLEEILSKLDTGIAQREAKALSEKPAFDVLVVGGGPAGAAAAVYAARKGIRTGVLAERLGGQTNDTLGIENYISVPQTSGPRFASDLETHARQYNVDIMPRQLAARLVPATQPGGLITVHTESGAVLRARAVVLSTGARWRQVNVPGEAEYRNKGVAYCPHCDGPLFKGKRVAVIGGGNSGVEAAIDLAGMVAHVSVIEYGANLKADAVLTAKLKSLSNVEIIFNAQTTRIVGDGGHVTGLVYRDRQTQLEHEVGLEGVFVQIGLVPNTEFLKEVVHMNSAGEIVVDDKGRTSVSGVFAAGDATTVPYKQIVIAAGDGAKAALSAFDHLIRSPEPA